MSDNESEAAPSSAPEWFKAYVQESKKRFGEIEKVIVRLSKAAEPDGAHEPAAGSSAEHNRPPSTATPDYQQTNHDRPRAPTSESVMPTTDLRRNRTKTTETGRANGAGGDSRGTSGTQFSLDRPEMRARGQADRTHPRETGSGGQCLDRREHRKGCSPRT